MKTHSSAITALLLSVVLAALLFVPGGAHPAAASLSAVTPTASTHNPSLPPTSVVAHSTPKAAIINVAQPTTNTLASSTASLNKAFVTVQSPDSVVVLDTATDKPIPAGIAAPTLPGPAAITPDGTQLFIAGHGNGTIYGFDTSSYTTVSTIPIIGEDQRGIAISPTGSRLYVADNFYQTVTVIDISAKQRIATIQLQAHPEQIALSPDGSRLYVAANFPDTNFVIDTTDTSKITSFQAGTFPHGVAVSPDGQRIFIASYDTGTVSVIDSNLNPITTLQARPGANFLRLSSDGHTLYVMSHDDNSVTVIDAVTLMTVKTVTLSSSPFEGALSEDGTKLYIALADGTMAIMDTVTNASPQYVRVGASGGMAISVATKPTMGSETDDLFAYPLPASYMAGRKKYGVTNSDLSGKSKCYAVAMTEVYHAGEDWFASTDTQVQAVADGVVYRIRKDLNYPGAGIIIQHRLPDGTKVWSVYAHLDPNKIRITEKTPDGKVTTVTKGQVIADGLVYQEYIDRKGVHHSNVHLHWEIRYFASASLLKKAPDYLKPCPTLEIGPGYTYPDRPNKFKGVIDKKSDGTLKYETYRWTNPSAFVASH